MPTLRVPPTPWLTWRPASPLLAEHGGLHPRGGLLHALRGVQLLFLGVRLLQGRRRLLHGLLGRLEVDVVDLLEVVHEDGELVGVHAGEAAHDHEGLPLALLLVAQHADVQRRHHGGVVRQHAQLATGAGQHDLGDRLRDAQALRREHLELHAVARGCAALLGAPSHGAPAGRGLPQGRGAPGPGEEQAATLQEHDAHDNAHQLGEDCLRPNHRELCNTRPLDAIAGVGWTCSSA
mmetsp:Transcript_58553/g.117186  ORF Transcript_58553/g.117186 Transcript_58553/m.117186 type:complete len:235 (-) Transcript_58553:32-736(-)